MFCIIRGRLFLGPNLGDLGQEEPQHPASAFWDSSTHSHGQVQRRAQKGCLEDLLEGGVGRLEACQLAPKLPHVLSPYGAPTIHCKILSRNAQVPSLTATRELPSFS